MTESHNHPSHSKRPIFDINVDLGEGSLYEAELMKQASSVNVACGGHAGNLESMRQSLELAVRHGVSAGAHPSYPDREHFGRRVMNISSDELRESLWAQLTDLQSVAAQLGMQLTHVKPHGALYNRAVTDSEQATVIAEVVAESGIEALYALAGDNELSRAAERLGLRIIPEAFADRGYTVVGTLIPRGEQGDILLLNAAIEQALNLVRGWVWSEKGAVRVPVMARTLCVHGDGAEALALLQALRMAFAEDGVMVVSPFHAKTGEA